MRKTLVVIFIFCCVLVSQSNAEATKTATNNTDLQTIQVSPKDEVSSMGESEAYRLLYENSKESNDTLRSTLHWSLGLVATFLLSLFGGQFLFNYRIKKEEISAIRSDLEEKISSLKNNLLEEIRETNKQAEEKISEFKINLLEEINEENKQTEKDIKEVMFHFETQTRENIDKIFEEKSKQIESINKLNDKNNEMLKKEISSTFKDFEIELEKIWGYVWDLVGVKTNALQKYLASAILEINEGREVKYTLDSILECLESLDGIEDRNYDSINILLGMIPLSSEAYKHSINEILKTKPVYELQRKADNTFLRNYIHNKPS